MTAVSARVAARAAYAAAGIHVVAAGAMLVLLRSGLPGPGNTTAERFQYVTEHTLAWRAGWLCWNAAGIALLAFYAALASRWHRGAPVRCVLAVILATAGLAADLSGQGIWMGASPVLDRDAFLVAEEAASVLTGFVANGLYTLAGVTLVWMGARVMPRWLVALSLVVWAAGLGLSAASLVQSSTGQVASTTLLLASFIAWCAFMGRWLSRCDS